MATLRKIRLMPLAGPVTGIRRSMIGSFACALLVLLCIIDHGQSKLDFLAWPMASAALLLVLGLPHGALDIELLINAADDPEQFSLTAWLVAYVGIALSIVLLWWLWPTAGLVVFLLLSAYHFGGDWTGYRTDAERFMVGTALLSAPTLFHESAVAVIFGWLIPTDMAAVVAGAMHLVSVPALLGVVALAVFRWRSHQAQYEEIIVVVGAAVVLLPLTFFVAYFCALHSMRHLVEVRETLSSQRVSVLIGRGAPYAAIALMSLAAGAMFFPSLPMEAAVLSSVFVGLAALTVPHMLLCAVQQSTSKRTALG